MDIQALILVVERRLIDKLDEVKESIHEVELSTEKRIAESEKAADKRFNKNEKDIHEIKIRSGLWGSMGGVLATAGLTLIKALTKD